MSFRYSKMESMHLRNKLIPVWKFRRQFSACSFYEFYLFAGALKNVLSGGFSLGKVGWAMLVAYGKGRTIRLQGGEQEVFVKKKLDPLKGKKKKTWPTHRRKKK